MSPLCFCYLTTSWSVIAVIFTDLVYELANYKIDLTISGLIVYNIVFYYEIKIRWLYVERVVCKDYIMVNLQQDIFRLCVSIQASNFYCISFIESLYISCYIVAYLFITTIYGKALVNLASFWSFLPQIYGIFNIHLPLLGHIQTFLLQIV